MSNPKLQAPTREISNFKLLIVTLPLSAAGALALMFYTLFVH